MAEEHNKQADSKLAFTSNNNLRTSSQTEWEIVVAPDMQKEYPERGNGFVEAHPDWVRQLVGLEEMRVRMTEQNKKLQAAAHPELIVEELIAGRLYTGPMYIKYNTVLRGKRCLAPQSCNHDHAIMIHLGRRRRRVGASEVIPLRSPCLPRCPLAR